MIALTDLFRLPPSRERDALIARERAEYRRETLTRARAEADRVAAAEDVSERVRAEAARLLRRIRKDPRRTIEQRRKELLDQTRPGCGVKSYRASDPP